LSGRLPFSADNDADLFRLIMKAELVFKSPQFDTVSETAKDLIRKLLVADPKKRLTAKQALEHPFLKVTFTLFIHSFIHLTIVPFSDSHY
jgi:serine/threonine protein kinase